MFLGTKPDGAARNDQQCLWQGRSQNLDIGGPGHRMSTENYQILMSI
jgi:hypothetical protein